MKKLAENILERGQGELDNVSVLKPWALIKTGKIKLELFVWVAEEALGVIEYDTGGCFVGRWGAGPPCLGGKSAELLLSLQMKLEWTYIKVAI